MNSINVAIIDNDESSRQKLKQFLEQKEHLNVKGEYNDLIEGYNAVLHDKPTIVIIDISDNSDLAFEIINKILLHNKSCMVIVTAYQTTSGTVIKAMRAGAREFITKPLDFNEVDAALEKIKNLLTKETGDKNNCKIYTVFSNKGGIGKTSLAVNLAMNLAEVTQEKVALIDLNLQLGDVTTFLDINPQFDISYVINNLNRIDEAFLLTTLEKYKKSNLYVLADPPYLEQAEEITSEQINQMLNVLKTVFSYIIIDTSSSFDGKTLSALDISDAILLVAMVNLPSIRNAQRCLDLFNRLGYNSEKIKILVNRYMSNDEIKIDDVEDVLNHPIYWKIPNNYFSIMASINKGIPVSELNPGSNVSRSFRRLAALMSGTVLKEEEPDSTSIEKTLEKEFPTYMKLFQKIFSWKK